MAKSGAGIYLIRKDGKMVEMTEEAYDSELKLQTLLEEYPNLLAGNQIDSAEPRRWLLVTREAPLGIEEGGGAWFSVDHLFIDQDGIPTLVEVKRSTDTRIRREVVGQMLDYAASAVINWPIEDIRRLFEARCERDGRDPDEALAEFLQEQHDVDDFWGQVKTNLQAGRVRLVFVSDTVPRELQRILWGLTAFPRIGQPARRNGRSAPLTAPTDGMTQRTAPGPKIPEARDEDGLIAAALAPVNQPGPAQPGSSVLRNVALGRLAEVSAEEPGHTRAMVTDGRADDWWGAGAGPLQWVSIDLGQVFAVSKICLLTKQSPACATEHRLYGKGAAGDWALLETFSNYTTDSAILEWAPSTPVELRYVKVETTKTESWVAWREIWVFAAQ